MVKTALLRGVALGAMGVLAFGAFPAMASPSCSWTATGWSCSGVSGNLNENPSKPVAAAAAGSAVGLQTSTVGARVQGVFAGARAGQRMAAIESTGMAAGDDSSRMSVWLSGAHSSLESDVDLNEFTGSNTAGTMGFDYMPSENLVYGVSVFVDRASLTTHYNLGSVKRVGYSVVPYVGYNFGQGTTVDAMVGGTYLSSDITRAGGAGRGSTDGYRMMFAANLHHNLEFGSWLVRGDVGYSYAHERHSSWTEEGSGAYVDETTANLASGKVGGRLGYTLGEFEPYTQVHYVYDFVRNNFSGAGTLSEKPANDADEIQAAIGFDWFATPTESVGVEFSHSFFREDQHVSTLMMNARLSF